MRALKNGGFSSVTVTREDDVAQAVKLAIEGASAMAGGGKITSILVDDQGKEYIAEKILGDRTNIYKDGDLLEALWPDNFYDYNESYVGTFCYTVTAEYSYCGESNHSNEACIDITVGIDELGENKVSLYPNPASNLVNITSINNMTRLTVTNYVGQVVYDRDVSTTRVELNTSSYQAGVYLVKIETETGVITKRVIIRK